MGQGLPAVLLALQGLGSLPVKKHSDAKKNVSKMLENKFPGEKIISLETSDDAQNLLRHIGTQRMRELRLREARPHMIADELAFEPSLQNAERGTLRFTGYVRGQPLSVNSLVHLVGWGDFQMTQIDAPEDPHPLTKRTKNLPTAMDADGPAARVLETASAALQWSLQSEAEVDPLDAEQTWPSESDLAEAEAPKKSRVIRVPKGTSDYQAAWIVDAPEQEGTVSDDESLEMDDAESDDEDEDEESEDDCEYEEISVSDDNSKYDTEMNEADDRKLLETFRAARQDAMFPDEIDTPTDIPARVRFQKFRGLQSFRTSQWDPQENLPGDYARIYQFANFKGTRQRLLTSETAGGAMPGWYVTVHIADVPREVLDGRPLVLFGLLEHEQRMSVVNLKLRRAGAGGAVLRSKQPVLLQVGYRRFTACPIYSQHTNGNKHKFERFFRPGETAVATVFAPVTYPPASALMFAATPHAWPALLAAGSLLSVDPNRLVVKRAVLSGHPFRIVNKTAVVRYMFFNRDDILWFKPVELRTKYGRRGHIKEPLGTHGHMKCVFNGVLKSMDTVLLTLYKRVFPKWTYDPRTSIMCRRVVELPEEPDDMFE